MRPKSNLHKRLTPFLIQNFKAMDLWVFIFIRCSTFSFQSNVGLRLIFEFLRLIFEFLNISPLQGWVLSILTHSPLSRSIPNHDYPLFKLSFILTSNAYLNPSSRRILIQESYCTRMRRSPRLTGLWYH